jgi:hypothetical protein
LLGAALGGRLAQALSRGIIAFFSTTNSNLCRLGLDAAHLASRRRWQ